ncbi:MAG: glutamyl-tRNA reductase [Candidatus Competibacteraceae bacterium]|nr:glutamyl-tRNA reductase [Candidatus Competibacteraceae bacterium]
MPLLALGINHKTAPVDIRERLAFEPARLEAALRDLRTRGGAREAAILSTCNRTELYCGLEGKDDARIIQWLGDYHALGARDLQPYLYRHPEQSAVRHMLRVAAGLDSMILGEPQILGQIKEAYHSASRAGTLGTCLSRLFQHSFSVAKQVRTDTRIGQSAVSVAFAAVSLSRQIFGELTGQTALLIGAGETIELVARHLFENRIGRLVIANRTLERARELALPFGGYAIGLNEIPLHLAEADIVISSTASPSTILERPQVEVALKKRKHRPMFMVDIAVPRDIDPRVAQLEDVYLYTVDDLQEIIQENLRSRRAAAKQAEEIIDTQVDHFMAWLRSQDSAGTIRSLRQQAQGVRDEVLERARRQLSAGKDPDKVLDFLATTLTNKLIHTPSAGLREAGAQGNAELVQAIKTLYKLNDKLDGGQ